ncbi:unnamed protein product, partial [Hapterophycus canaliculatus]
RRCIAESQEQACTVGQVDPPLNPRGCSRCLRAALHHRPKCLECGKKGAEMDSHNRAVKIPGGVSRCQLSSCGRFYHKVRAPPGTA